MSGDASVNTERRLAGPDLRVGAAAGTGDPDQAAPMGERAILVAGSMICSTSSPTRRSCWWRGTGCGATRAHARPGVDGQTATTSRPNAARRRSSPMSADALRSRRFRPLPVRERMIPKPGTRKRRRLGIPTVADRVVQASLKLVLEPIFEADFQPCSYGFRPEPARAGRGRRGSPLRLQPAQLRVGVGGGHHGVLRRDLTSGPDGPGAGRIGDKRVLALVKAFLKAGILTGDGLRGTPTPAPRRAGSCHRCWPTSPCPSSTSTSPAPVGGAGRRWQRERRRRDGLGQLAARPLRGRLRGHGRAATDAHAEALRDEVSGGAWPRWVCACRRPRPGSPTSTRASTSSAGASSATASEDTSRQLRLHLPVEEGAGLDHGKVQDVCRHDTNRTLADLLHRLNPVLRGWSAYFRPGVSARPSPTCARFTWRQVIGWLRRKHRRITWKDLRRRYCDGGWWPSDGEVTLFNPAAGAHHPLPLPGNTDPLTMADRSMRITPDPHGTPWRAGCGEKPHVRFGRRAGETGRSKDRHRAAARPHVVKVRDGQVANRPIYVVDRGHRGRGTRHPRPVGRDRR